MPALVTPALDEEALDDLEDAPDTEAAAIEQEILDQATAARTLEELQAEIETLKRLEDLALRVRQSGEDRKWRELASLLGEIFAPRPSPPGERAHRALQRARCAQTRPSPARSSSSSASTAIPWPTWNSGSPRSLGAAMPW